MTQKMKILIGYDGSDCSEAALDDLSRAGLPDIVEAHILSVREWLKNGGPTAFLLALPDSAIGLKDSS